MDNVDSGLVLQSISRGYDSIAAEYARRIGNELAGKPQDRLWLQELAHRCGTRAPLIDLGCGPGHVGACLANCGASVIGLDISAEMVRIASHAHPGMSAIHANMTRIPLESHSCGGIAAFYSLIHLTDENIAKALRECLRVTVPGGCMLAAFHIGTEAIHREEMWGTPVDMTFRFFSTEHVRYMFQNTTWTIEWIQERDPIPEVEHPTRRVYAMVRAS